MPGPLEIDEVRPPDGVLLVDKPEGITSHGVVARVRRTYGTRKVGHAGTLDPMATGLLLLGLGPSSRDPAGSWPCRPCRRRRGR